MATVAGVILKEHQHIEIALTYIYGIGRSTSRKICDELKLDYSKRVKDLGEKEYEGIRQIISKMVVEGECRRRKRMDIKAKMDMGSYQGKRHRAGLRVRGQRTQNKSSTRRRRDD